MYLRINLYSGHTRRPKSVVLAHSEKLADDIFKMIQGHFRATVYNELRQLYPNHACKQFLSILAMLENECGFGPNAIPQLEDISKFLKSNELLHDDGANWSRYILCPEMCTSQAHGQTAY